MTGGFTIAVHALVFLKHKDATVPSDEIAENVCTNPARIRKVMASLKKAGLVETREGIKGGYHIGENASHINLAQISDALGEESVKASWKSGNPEMTCLIASGMAGIMDGIYSELNAVCREKLESITLQSIENQIFKNK